LQREKKAASLALLSISPIQPPLFIRQSANYRQLEFPAFGIARNVILADANIT